MKSAVLQKQPLDGAVVPLQPASTLFFGHQPLNAVTDPADELGHLSVDPIFASACAAFTPAHDASDKIGVVVARDVWPTAITFAGIFRYFIIASTEHAGRDAQLGGFHAG